MPLFLESNFHAENTGEDYKIFTNAVTIFNGSHGALRERRGGLMVSAL